MSLGDCIIDHHDSPREWADVLIKRGHPDDFVQIHVERETGKRYTLEQIARFRSNPLKKDREWNKSYDYKYGKEGQCDEADGNRFIDRAIDATDELAAALRNYGGARC